MQLLKTEKNQIFDLIQEIGLSPTQFEWQRDGTLQLKNSSFHFRPRSIMGKLAIHCSPRDENMNSNYYPESWVEALQKIKLWLQRLKLEITSDDKWQRLQEELANLNGTFGTNYEDKAEDSSVKFSITEFEGINTKIAQVKEGFEQISSPISKQQLTALNSKLDFLVNEAKSSSKVNWKMLFLGAIIGTILRLGITKETANEIWQVIANVFSSTFLLPH